jgi:hypothetical protein
MKIAFWAALVITIGCILGAGILGDEGRHSGLMVSTITLALLFFFITVFTAMVAFDKR